MNALPEVRGTAQVPPELRGYPVQFGVRRQDDYARLLPLVKWLLAIPHFFVLTFLGIAAWFVVVYAFFAVLFTGEYPRGAFDFLVGVQRWALRVTAYSLLLVDPYPPFSLDEDSDYPVRLEVAIPQDGVDNWRPLVHWLLIWPYMVVAGALVFAAGFAAIASFFTILFTRELPRGIFEFTEIALRWQTRANAYAYFVVTRYPPFAWG